MWILILILYSDLAWQCWDAVLAISGVQMKAYPASMIGYLLASSAKTDISALPLSLRYYRPRIVRSFLRMCCPCCQEQHSDTG